MADVAPQHVSSPDGRDWMVSVERRRRTLKETRDVPFFWAHIVATAIVCGVLIWLLRHDWSGIWAVAIPAAVIIWLIGFVSASISAMVRAETQGPPPEHRLWKVDKRKNRAVAAQGVAAAIGRGELSTEPPHTELEEI